MAYLSLYRKYRSQTFSDLIGQDHVVRTLQNAVSTGKIAHAYLFTGPRGTGKTSSARLLAKCLNCETGPTPEPCNHCEQCISITQGNCVDVYELDAASESGVDNVRDTIVDASQYTPNFCRYKIFIIDEVHDLSSKAFDALLKTIEEPPAHVIFILATTEYNKVPPTIRSRCQKYEFHRASLQHLVERLTYVTLAEGAEVEPAALTAIARMADGGYRDALTLLEQALLTSEGKITLQHVYDQLGLVSEETVDGILTAMRHSNVAQIMDHLGEVARRGRDPRAVLESMMYRLSDLTRAAYTVDVGTHGDATREAALFDTAAHIGRENLLWMRGAIAEAHKAIRDVSLPRIWLEAELIRIATVSQAPQKREAAAPPMEEKHIPAETRAAAPPQTERTPPRKEAAEPPKTNGETRETPAEAKAVVEAPVRKGAGTEPAEIWQAVLAELPSSTAIAMKLADSSYLGFDDGVLRIGILQIHLTWFDDNAKRRAHITQVVQKVAGKPWTIKFEVNKNGTQAAKPEPEAVELPVEGEPLHKLASEILGPQR